AGVDVYEREPEVHQRLLAAPRTVLLPHIGSASVATRAMRVRVATPAPPARLPPTPRAPAAAPEPLSAPPPTERRPARPPASRTRTVPPTVPGARFAAPGRATPVLNTGKPWAARAVTSRTSPSMTRPARPRASAAVVSTSPQ